jgi:hypothetical protein
MADTQAVTADAGDERRPESADRGNDGGNGPTRPLLTRVDGPLAGQPNPPTVTLHREFKGLTVADLLRSEIVDRLPGQVRSALQHLQRGDFAAAERALPGEFAPVLPGPGHRRAERRAAWLWLAAFVAVVAMTIAGALAW